MGPTSPIVLGSDLDRLGAVYKLRRTFLERLPIIGDRLFTARVSEAIRREHGERKVP
jgi:hypothetical protein